MVGFEPTTTCIQSTYADQAALHPEGKMETRLGVLPILRNTGSLIGAPGETRTPDPQAHYTWYSSD